MDALTEIECAMASYDPNFKTLWKPKFDAIRESMMSPELKKGMHDLVKSMVGDVEVWPEPLNQLQ